MKWNFALLIAAICRVRLHCPIRKQTELSSIICTYVLDWEFNFHFLIASDTPFYFNDPCTTFSFTPLVAYLFEASSYHKSIGKQAKDPFPFRGTSFPSGFILFFIMYP